MSKQSLPAGETLTSKQDGITFEFFRGERNEIDVKFHTHGAFPVGDFDSYPRMKAAYIAAVHECFPEWDTYQVKEFVRSVNGGYYLSEYAAVMKASLSSTLRPKAWK